MRSRRASLFAVLALLGLPAWAHAASISSLGLTTGFDGGSSTQAPFGAWMGPSLSLEGPRAAFGLDARVGSSFAGTDRAARMRLATMLRDRGWLRPELVVLAASGTGLGTGVRQSLRAHIAGAHAGVWVAASSEATVGGEQRASLRVPLLGFGAWARRQHISFAGAIEQNVGLLRVRSEVPDPPDTTRGSGGVVGVGDGIAGGLRYDPKQVMLSSAYASVRWDGDRIELESVGGVTVGAFTPPRRWAQARAAWRFTPQLALVATAGSRAPQYFALDPTGERQAALALRFSQSNSVTPRITLASRSQAMDCRIRRIGEGLCRVIVRAPGARLVEIQGDVTQWEPVALQPMSGERWEAEIQMGLGVHQLGIRVDGGPWMPPPGFPAAPDGFGGSTGVVVIE